MQPLSNAGPARCCAGSGPFLTSNRERLAALAASHALPTIYHQREVVAAGGLMSYGTSITSMPIAKAGIYVGRILKGEKPADLPVHAVRPSSSSCINLKTAKALPVATGAVS